MAFFAEPIFAPAAEQFFVPKDPSADRIPALHTVGFGITFLAAVIGFSMLSRRMARDPRWQSLATYTLATGIAMLVLFLAGSGLVRPPGAPLHAWLGLFQWILLAVWFPCTIVLALRLLRVARSVDGSQTVSDPTPGLPGR